MTIIRTISLLTIISISCVLIAPISVYAVINSPTTSLPSHNTKDHNHNSIPNNLLSYQMNSTYYVTGMPPMWCDDSATEPSQHIATFTDRGGNTVDMYCQWNQWLGSNQSERQFIAYYHDAIHGPIDTSRIIVGMCPFDYGLNSWQMLTDEKTGLINETSWLSVAPDGRSVYYHNEFNTFKNGQTDIDGLPPYTASEGSIDYLNPRDIISDRIMGVNGTQ